MFTDHGTFIIGFSVAKHHLAVAPERAGINHFSDEIVQADYNHSKELVRISWDSPVDLSLLSNEITVAFVLFLGFSSFTGGHDYAVYHVYFAEFSDSLSL